MQQTDLGLNLSTKKTRKREFLEQMQQVVPWRDMVALIAPYAPEGRKGRPPFPVEMLLRSSALQEQLEQFKSKIRAKVEHPFRVIKRQFGHVKVRYRGLSKNTQQLHTLFALANLWMARGRLLVNIQSRPVITA